MIFLANLAGIGACPGPTEFESVMADMGEKVETKADKVNAPDDAPDETLAAQDAADSPEEQRRSLVAKGHSLEVKR